MDGWICTRHWPCIHYAMLCCVTQHAERCASVKKKKHVYRRCWWSQRSEKESTSAGTRRARKKAREKENNALGRTDCIHNTFSTCMQLNIATVGAALFEHFSDTTTKNKKQTLAEYAREACVWRLCCRLLYVSGELGPVSIRHCIRFLNGNYIIYLFLCMGKSRMLHAYLICVVL